MLRFRNPTTKDINELVIAPEDIKLVRDHYNLGRYEALDKLSLRAARVAAAANKGADALAALKPSAVDSIVVPLLLEQNVVSDEVGRKVLDDYANRNYETHKQSNARMTEDARLYDAVLKVIADPSTTPDTLYRWVVTALYPQPIEKLQQLEKIASTIAHPPQRVKGGVYWQNLVRRYRQHEQEQKEIALEVAGVAMALKSGELKL